MPLRHNRPRAQQAKAKSLVEAGFETNLIEHLTQTLSRGGFSGPLVMMVRRLGATRLGALLI